MLNDNQLVEVFKTSENIFNGVVVTLNRDTVTLPDGNEATREVIRHRGAVAVVPITDEDEIVCVEQFRYPFSEILLEIPAGKLDFVGEDPDFAARRELREETGASCQKLVPLGTFYGSPAILDEKIYLYAAIGLAFGETDTDDDEFLRIKRIPLSELEEMILDGKVPDGKTQAAILRVRAMKDRGIL